MDASFNGQEFPPGTRLHKADKNMTKTCNLSENRLLVTEYFEKM